MRQKKNQNKNPLYELKGKMRAERQTIRSLASTINMAPNTLCLKLNGIYDFTGTEIVNICNALCISAKDIPKYFFPQMLPEATKSAG